MTKEEREQVDKYRKALTVPENGHKAIADKVAKEHSKTLEGSGRTSQAAGRNFQYISLIRNTRNTGKPPKRVLGLRYSNRE